MGKRTNKPAEEKEPEEEKVEGATEAQDTDVDTKPATKPGKKAKLDLPEISEVAEFEVVRDGINLPQDKPEKFEKFPIQKVTFPKGSVAVFVGSKFVRAYSEEKHGESFVELAQGFAEKNKEKGVELKVLAEGGTCLFVGFREILKKTK